MPSSYTQKFCNAPQGLPLTFDPQPPIMRIAIGTDHRGFAIRSKIIALVKKLGHEAIDVGAASGESVDYPDVAAEVAH
jgi:hypothetical protein